MNQFFSASRVRNAFALFALSLLCVNVPVLLPFVPKARLVQVQAQTPEFKRAGELLQQGMNQYFAGQFPLAIQSLQEALQLAQAIGDRNLESVILTFLTMAYSAQGEYEKTIDLDRRALTIAQESGAHRLEATSLSSLGGTYLVLEEYEKAIEYYQQALNIVKRIGEGLYFEGLHLNHLGRAYSALEEHEKAIEYYQQALQAFTLMRESGARGGDINFLDVYSLNGLGRAYSALGEYEKAIDFHQQAFALVREVGIGGYLEKGTSLNDLGVAFFKSGQLVKAEEALFQGIEVLESIETQLESVNSQFRALLGSGYPQLGAQAVDNNKIQRFDQRANAYRTLQKVLIAQNKTDRALEVSERGRARVLIELMQQRLSPNAIEKIESLHPNLEQIKQIAKAQNATLVEYSIVYDEFEIYGTKQGRESQLYIWVVKPTGQIDFRSVPLPSDQSLADLTEVVLERMKGARGRGTPPELNPNSSEVFQQTLRQLNQLLIAPIADLLPTDETDRIIFIPHRELFFIPFAALQDAEFNYLIEKHTILTAPSIQSLDLTRQHRDRIGGRGAMLAPEIGNPLVVGNPTMPKNKVGQPPEELEPLPGAETEAKNIATLLNTQPLIGSQATESAVVRRMGDADLIHLATHGLLDDINGVGAPGAIVLSPSSDDDGFLTTDEIMKQFALSDKQPLNADLIVLSACDTGGGKVTGDGVVGLSRSLIAAGAPSIIVSLWKVPDHATQALMTDFYTNLYEKKMDKATALRQAMLEMIEGKYPDPAAWAGFTLVGEAM